MKTKLLIISNKVLSALISLLGIGTFFSINNCESSVEYGTPHASYKVNGKVLSQTEQPVPNVRVTMDYDTAYTDIDGKYEVNTNASPGTDTFNIQFEDIDGEQNGLYFDVDTSVAFEDPEFEGGDGNWYKGETSKEINIKLDEHE